jgi:MerR family mercuric resistance operon transcriptional regulator
LLGLGRPGKASCAEVREVAAHHLEHVRAKIVDLVKLEGLLSETIDRCSGETVPDCAVLDLLDKGRAA